MRIVGGIHSSRKILPPEGAEVTRPITDRVKTSMFDRLAARGFLNGGNAVDLFAGTGSLGLEALSRGVDHCTFIERDRSARLLLEKNIETLRLTGQSRVLAVDALSPVWLNVLPHKPISLIFCDPPYKMTQDEKDLARVIKLIESIAQVTDKVTLLSLRTDDQCKPPAAEGWEGPETHDYGSMQVHFYTRVGPREEGLGPGEKK